MGWWSFDILGGDEPLDGLCAIERLTGTKNLHIMPVSRNAAEKLEQNIGKLLRNCAHETTWLQALAYVMMRHGAKIDNKTKEVFLDACERDEFDNPQRIQVIRGFMNILRNYAGKPQELTSETLWEAMENKKDQGLVNKNLNL